MDPTERVRTVQNTASSLHVEENSSSDFISSISEKRKCCADCKTTKTPLWRGGPAGPKSLCNACGIRYRKKRRAMMDLKKGAEVRKESTTQTAAAGTGSRLSESFKVKLVVLGKEVVLRRSCPSPSSSIVKKQRKLGEEEQAAICLMALSCGFVFA